MSGKGKSERQGEIGEARGNPCVKPRIKKKKGFRSSFQIRSRVRKIKPSMKSRRVLKEFKTNNSKHTYDGFGEGKERRESDEGVRRNAQQQRIGLGRIM